MLKNEADNFCMSWIKRSQKKGAIRRFATVLLPDHLLVQLKFELYMLFVRTRSRHTHLSYRGKHDLLLNIGAGDTGRDGWVNIDGLKVKGVNCNYDARKRLPFPDGSVKGIFTEHFLEHLDYTEEVPSFLAECYRVLKEGGIIRIIIPDAGKYIKAYVQDGWQEIAAVRQLRDDVRDPYFHYDYNTKMELINVIFRQEQEHKFAYDFETIELLLKRHGFNEVTKREFRQSANPELSIDSEGRAAESLYVEAKK